MTRSRFLNGAEASRCYGVLAGTYAVSLTWADPLADATAEALQSFQGPWWPAVAKALEQGIDSVPGAPPALGALIASLPGEPTAEQRAVMERGRAAIARTGDDARVVLRSASLLMQYWSPPVIGAMVPGDSSAERALGMLAQSDAWWAALHQPDGVGRGGSGFASTVRIRLAYAFLRRIARESGAWDREAWGEPVNQGDLFFQIVCFTRLMLDGLQRLGHQPTAEEVDGYYAFWRQVAAVLGVHKTWLAMIDANECDRFWYLWRLTSPGPDERSRALVGKALEALAAAGGGSALRRRTRHSMLCGMAYRLLDWDVAQNLGVPHTAVGQWSGRLYRPLRSFSGSAGGSTAGDTVVSSTDWLESLASSGPGKP